MLSPFFRNKGLTSRAWSNLLSSELYEQKQLEHRKRATVSFSRFLFLPACLFAIPYVYWLISFTFFPLLFLLFLRPTVFRVAAKQLHYYFSLQLEILYFRKSHELTLDEYKIFLRLNPYESFSQKHSYY